MLFFSASSNERNLQNGSYAGNHPPQTRSHLLLKYGLPTLLPMAHRHFRLVIFDPCMDSFRSVQSLTSAPARCTQPRQPVGGLSVEANVCLSSPSPSSPTNLFIEEICPPRPYDFGPKPGRRACETGLQDILMSPPPPPACGTKKDRTGSSSYQSCREDTHPRNGQ